MRQQPGHEFITLTPAQLDAWRDAVEPLRTSWADSVKKVGIDPAQAQSELKAAIAKYTLAK
jgi:hypothetical protein